MNLLLQPLRELEAFRLLKNKLEKKAGPLAVSGVTDEQKAHLAYALTAEKARQKLIITHNELRVRELADSLGFYEKEEVLSYPAKDMIFYQADVRSQDIVRLRLQVLRRLLAGDDITVICSIEALKDPMLPREAFARAVISLEPTQTFAQAELMERLVNMGYERVAMIEERGEFALRGGILDIFPPFGEFAVRIEFFDDEIDSIRLINPDTQRSVREIDDFTIFPNREIVLEKGMAQKAVAKVKADHKATAKKLKGNEEALTTLDKTVAALLDKIENNGSFAGIEGNLNYYFEKSVSLLDYFNAPVIILDEPIKISDSIKALETEYGESLQSRFEKGYLLLEQMRGRLDYKQILSQAAGGESIYFSSLYQAGKEFPYQEEFQIAGSSAHLYRHDFEAMVKDLAFYVKQQYKVVVLSATGAMMDSLQELLENHDLPVFRVNKDGQAVAGKIALVGGQMKQGFIYPEIRWAVFAEAEVSSGRKRKKAGKKVAGQRLQSFYDLKAGDYVVHESHGIGIFAGVETIETDGMARDFIKIKYRDEGNLFIPTTQLDRIQKYIGGEGIAPKLSKLGGQEWKKTVTKAKKAIDEMVADLIALYAHREQRGGYEYSADSVWQNEFEELFPYEETDDQLNAIAEMKADMCSNKIMDRLVCGDVGYGKTEVAIRGAFKAIQDEKQVAYLVPTTILAQQHYNNFVQRFKDFPVRIGILSRFSTPKEIKKTLEDLERGLVDMVVGTHRLLSKDVKFKDLGLLIIDEEQRFGVKHKEKIKQLKENIDVLTLTATPIPRTLHMSLIGIRDMSVLEEPPHERQPIQTYVLEHDDALIRDAIYREINRNGQIYYVYNRVRSIEDVTARLQALVPEASIAYAHGQMSEHELESIMLAFIQGEIDVLVATTIIETGLDIPNVNTIIIQDADKMGLSQLYQLRGRVGRSSRVAYAYLTYKRDKVLQEVAEKRLKAIREFTEFGSGFRIAMRDLEIRGAGNVLGTSQSGHLDAIGYELYTKLVAGSIHSKTGQAPAEDGFETAIELKIDAYIPPEYIAGEEEKLSAYKKIASIKNEEDHLDILDELIDRYGNPPKCVENLLNVGLIKGLAHHLDITAIQVKGAEIELRVLANARFDGARLLPFLEERKKEMRFSAKSGESCFYVKINSNSTSDLLAQIKAVLKDLRELQVAEKK
ncbi:transcription-repair coupling factor [Clostridiales bacterium COT073_COT-073]|nr:transcription-repair coupling factor [Clostridiales bacterium COT073_COT-073]